MFKVDADSGEIWVYDEIGPSWWGLIDAGAVIDGLKEIGDKRATIRLNTPGGSVDEGIAIYNAIRSHRAGVITIADSMAASMGSYLLQAGVERYVASNAMVMIHDPWSIAIGNAAEFRKSADVLDKYAARMVPDYAARSGKTEDEVKAIMAEETWYTGREAVEAGFADKVLDEVDSEPVVSISLMRACTKMPQSLLMAKEQVANLGDTGKRPFPSRHEWRQIANKMSYR